MLCCAGCCECGCGSGSARLWQRCLTTPTLRLVSQRVVVNAAAARCGPRIPSMDLRARLYHRWIYTCRRSPLRAIVPRQYASFVVDVRDASVTASAGGGLLAPTRSHGRRSERRSGRQLFRLHTTVLHALTPGVTSVVLVCADAWLDLSRTELRQRVRISVDFLALHSV